MSEAPTREAVVEKIVEGGLGLARDGDRAIFLPLVAPGERVRYEVVRARGHRIEGRLTAVVTPSPDRIEPRCPLYGTCGGCQLQHLADEAQRIVKRDAAIETLRRLGAGPIPDAVTIAPSPRPFGYRHRATFHIDWRDGEPNVGFHRAKSHETIDVPACPLLEGPLNAALAQARTRLLPALRPIRPSRVEIVALDDGRCEAAFGGAPAPEGDAAGALLAAASSWPELRGLYWEESPSRYRRFLARGEPLEFEAPDAGGGTRRLSFDVRVFTQANLAANALLVSALIDATSSFEGSRLLDLYAGCGNLSLPLIARMKQAHLVEADAAALEHAERNAGSARNRVSFTLGSAREVAARLAAEGARFELALLDPPRSGAAEVVRLLPQLVSDRIFYVSCNVPTLARDLALLARGGFRLAALRLFDFYPQTAHVEALAELARAESRT